MSKRCAVISAVVLAAAVLSPPLTEAASARVERNVVFGMYAGLALVMDVHYPQRARGVGLLLVPGSGWHNPGSLKQGYPYINALRDALVDDGFTVFVPNHRSSPTYRFPSALLDTRRAVRFIRVNAAKFNIDPARIGGVGHSSGAHLVAMLAVEDGEGSAASAEPIARESFKTQATVAIAAPFDLIAFDSGFGLATVTAFMGERPPMDRQRRPVRAGIYRDGSPISFVSADDGPFLIIHGEQDPVVPYRNLKLMQRALTNVGGSVTAITVAGQGHAPKLDLGRIVTWLNENLAAE